MAESTVVRDENEKPYKVHLCKTDIGQNSNKFYDMELFEKSTGANKFVVKLINGRIGYKGVTHLKEFGDVMKAKTFFEKKFEEKTHLDWDNRQDAPMPGRYVVVELASKDDKKEVKKEVEVKEEVVEKEKEEEKPKTRGRKKKAEVDPKKEIVEEEDDGGIPETVRQFLKCICDEDIHLGMLKQLKFNEEYGKPIDCLSLAQLETGYEILMHIEDSISISEGGKTTRGRKKPAPVVKSSGSIIQDTNKYYSLIPHAFGFSVPPRIDTLHKVQQERELLDALKGTIEAAQSIKDLKKSSSSKDIYHRLYDKLPCSVEPVDPKTAESIGECLKLRAPTHLYNLSLVKAYEVKGRDEKEEVKPKRRKVVKKESLLLWHGTRVTNVFSILMNGMQIPVGPRGDLMFGNGVYFANVPSKSANYCKPTDNGSVFMLLCEVNVENPLVFYESETNAAEMMREKKKGLVIAAGRQTPKEKIEINGIPIFKSGLKDIEEESELLYDEYVAYEKEKFKIKYVVEVNTRKLTLEEMMAA